MFELSVIDQISTLIRKFDLILELLDQLSQSQFFSCLCLVEDSDLSWKLPKILYFVLFL